jgi:hypothetical protein
MGFYFYFLKLGDKGIKKDTKHVRKNNMHIEIR